MSDDMSAARALHREAIEKWLAVQSETRGVGIDGAGDLRSPLSHEKFERFVYHNFPAILDALNHAAKRRHPTLEERTSRAMTLDYATRDDFTTVLREAHDDLDDAQNDLIEASERIAELEGKIEGLRKLAAPFVSLLSPEINGVSVDHLGRLILCGPNVNDLRAFTAALSSEDRSGT